MSLLGYSKLTLSYSMVHFEGFLGSLLGAQMSLKGYSRITFGLLWGYPGDHCGGNLELFSGVLWDHFGVP